jgi:drug/metabolite transporter (DMT)-like permease
MTAQTATTASPRGSYGVGSVFQALNYPALVATIFWAGNKTALKFALAEMDPLLVALSRMVIAGVVLVVVARWLERGRSVPREALPRILALGMLGMGFNAVLFTYGLSLTSVSNSALISTLSPVFCIAMVLISGQERVARRTVAGVALSMTGVLLLIQHDAASGNSPSLLGDLLLVGSSITWAGYSVYCGKVMRSVGPVAMTGYTLLAGAVVVAAFCPLMVGSWSLENVSAIAWSGVVYAAILSSVVGLTLWNIGVRQVGATQTMVYTYLAPLLAIGSAAALLGETLSLAQVAGGAIVLAGLSLSARRRAAAR